MPSFFGSFLFHFVIILCVLSKKVPQSEFFPFSLFLPAGAVLSALRPGETPAEQFQIRPFPLTN